MNATGVTRITRKEARDLACPRLRGRPGIPAADALDPDPSHDGRLVADMVGEWAQVHGEPFELHLTGPAGGDFSQGDDGEQVEMDALNFIRTLSGRLPGEGVMSHALPCRARHP